MASRSTLLFELRISATCATPRGLDEGGFQQLLRLAGQGSGPVAGSGRSGGRGQLTIYASASRVCFVPEAVTGFLDKNVFERRFAERDGGDLARKGGDKLRDKLMAIGAFNPQDVFHGLYLDAEFLFNLGAQTLGICRFDRDHVPPDLLS